jgi:hypothetical protein
MRDTELAKEEEKEGRTQGGRGGSDMHGKHGGG